MGVARLTLAGTLFSIGVKNYTITPTVHSPLRQIATMPFLESQQSSSPHWEVTISACGKAACMKAYYGHLTASPGSSGTDQGIQTWHGQAGHGVRVALQKVLRSRYGTQQCTP